MQFVFRIFYLHLIMEAYLVSVKKLFAYYKKLGDDAMEQGAGETEHGRTGADGGVQKRAEEDARLRKCRQLEATHH